jgi:hypothetical protein
VTALITQYTPSVFNLGASFLARFLVSYGVGSLITITIEIIVAVNIQLGKKR